MERSELLMVTGRKWRSVYAFTLPPFPIPANSQKTPLSSQTQLSELNPGRCCCSSQGAVGHEGLTLHGCPEVTVAAVVLLPEVTVPLPVDMSISSFLLVPEVTDTTPLGPEVGPVSSPTPNPGPYHERQSLELCAVHALNNLLQTNHF
eukprot:g16563.t1